MRIELRHIRSFIAVAEELHFRRAAERLCMTQPGLSRTIRCLEEMVGVALLARSTRSVELTTAGGEFLEECQLALLHLDRAVGRAKSAAAGHIGHLSVGYMDFAINGPLPGILERFRQAHPGITVELSYMPTAQQKQGLLQSKIDLGFLIGPIFERGLRQFSVRREGFVALLPERHRLAAQDTVELVELAHESFILGSPTWWSTYRQMTFDLCAKAGFVPRVVQAASTSDGIFGLVAANIGISLYAECVANIRRKGLIVRPLTGTDAQIETVVAWQASNRSPSLEKFRKFILSFISQTDCP